MSEPEQRRLTQGDLLTPDGCLAQAGYATAPVRRYDRAAIRAGALRIKEWDYYCIMDGTHVLALTLADNGYMGLDSVSLLNLQTGWQQTRSFMRLLPLGRTGLPPASDIGRVEVDKPAYGLCFENRDGLRILTVRVEDFDHGRALIATVLLSDPPDDSLVIATPFAGKPHHFYYNQKINNLRAEGRVKLGEEYFDFEPGKAFGVLDWGRGVWTYRNTWYWSSLSGMLDGVPFGFNLGYGFGDTRAATENMLFYNGQAHKLGTVTFAIPQTAAGKEDYLRPWRIADAAGRLDLRFEPALDRAARTDLLVLKSDQHQVFGYFSGTATLDKGTVLTLTGMAGFAEKVSNCW